MGFVAGRGQWRYFFDVTFGHYRGIWNLPGDVFRRRRRPQITDAGLAQSRLAGGIRKQPQIILPALDNSAEPLLAHRPGMKLRQHALRVIVGIEILLANFSRKVVRLLDGAHVDLRVLVEIVIERGRTGFGGANQKEVRQLGHECAAEDATTNNVGRRVQFARRWDFGRGEMLPGM